MKLVALLILAGCSSSGTATSTGSGSGSAAPVAPIAPVDAAAPGCPSPEACRDEFIETGSIAALKRVGPNAAPLVALVEKNDPLLGTNAEMLVTDDGAKALLELKGDATANVTAAFEAARVAHDKMVRAVAIDPIVKIDPPRLEKIETDYQAARAAAHDAAKTACATDGKLAICNNASVLGITYGMAPGRGGMRSRTPAVPTVSVGVPTTDAGMDKAVVRRYIKRDIQKIQYCYEKMLAVNPELSGTVTVKFTITPNGTVTNAIGKGVHAEVASCVADVIMRIEFPKPKSGAAVPVSFPFDFRRSGG